MGDPFGRICYPSVLNIRKQRSLSEGKSNCNPIVCFSWDDIFILFPFYMLTTKIRIFS